MKKMIWALMAFILMAGISSPLLLAKSEADKQRDKELADKLLGKILDSALNGKKDKNAPQAKQKGCEAARPNKGLAYGSPESINTPGWEDSPYVTPDGQALYFMYTPWNFFPIFTGGLPKKLGPAREGHHENTKNAFEDSDNYVSFRLADGNWSKPQNLGFNDERADCCMMISSDGNTTYYQRTLLSNGSETELALSRKNADGSWGKPVRLDIPRLEGESNKSNPHMMPGENKVYYNLITKKDGKAQKDLYYSVKSADGSWSAPISMGSSINTKGEEDQIWLSDDGQTAYFNRDSDIVKSVRLGGSAENEQWSEPVKQSFQKPVMVAEASLTADQNTMYLMRVDTGKKDIFVAVSKRLGENSWSFPQDLK